MCVWLYENVYEFECQHGADLLLGEAGLDELGLRDPPVVVLVHLLERHLGNRRLTLVLRVVIFTEQMKQGFHNTVHLFPADGFVVIYVEDPEDLFEVFLWGSRRQDVEDQHKLPEVDKTVPVRIVHSEYMLFQLLGVSRGVAHLHHLSELFFGDFSVGMPLEEVCIPLVDVLSGQGSVAGDEVEVLVGEDRLAAAVGVAHLAAAAAGTAQAPALTVGGGRSVPARRRGQGKFARISKQLTM